MEINIFKTIEEVFKLNAKTDILSYINTEIEKFVEFFKRRGYNINPQQGFTETYRIPQHRDDTIYEQWPYLKCFTLETDLMATGKHLVMMKIQYVIMEG